MQHARPDYDRIQDPAEIIPADEPVFLLRGQDRFASIVVDMYADFLEKAGGSPLLIQMARVHAGRMRRWHQHKMPDITPEQVAS